MCQKQRQPKEWQDPRHSGPQGPPPAVLPHGLHSQPRALAALPPRDRGCLPLWWSSQWIWEKRWFPHILWVARALFSHPLHRKKFLSDLYCLLSPCSSTTESVLWLSPGDKRGKRQNRKHPSHHPLCLSLTTIPVCFSVCLPVLWSPCLYSLRSFQCVHEETVHLRLMPFGQHMAAL